MGSLDFGICWDLGDVLFCEETELKAPNGVTQRVVLVPGVGELVRSLYAQGIPMAIVSDTRLGACENVLGPHRLSGCFSHVSISEALGVEKPHPEMFLSASRALGLPPEKLAMVGNHYYRDVEGARAVGMTAIWFHWNDRYPAPEVSPAASYVAHDADSLAVAINHWTGALYQHAVRSDPAALERALES